MREIKVFFVDFPLGFLIENDFFYQFLCRYYNVVIDPNPDYLFYSCFGYQHWKYKGCVKIFYTGENITPDFNICDYGIGFHHIELEDRYIRFPYYLREGLFKLPMLQMKHIGEDLADRKFCNFVYSNKTVVDPFRELFFRELSKYKKIDSGGRCLNNIGYPILNKIEFIKDYKFTISIENSAVSGYTTEKIFEPMIVNSMPIYYGDPNIQSDFNPDAFIHLRDYKSLKEAIDYIVYLDENRDAYLAKLSHPWFVFDDIQHFYMEKLHVFFRNIFDNPIDQVKRAPEYGWAMKYQREQRRVAPLADNYFFRKLWGLIDRMSNGGHL